MLTKTDLGGIKKIVRGEIEAEARNLKDSFEHEIRTANLHLRAALNEQGDRIKNVEVRLSSVENEIKGFKKRCQKTPEGCKCSN